MSNNSKASNKNTEKHHPETYNLAVCLLTPLNRLVMSPNTHEGASGMADVVVILVKRCMGR